MDQSSCTVQDLLSASRVDADARFASKLEEDLIEEVSSTVRAVYIHLQDLTWSVNNEDLSGCPYSSLFAVESWKIIHFENRNVWCEKAEIPRLYTLCFFNIIQWEQSFCYKSWSTKCAKQNVFKSAPYRNGGRFSFSDFRLFRNWHLGAGECRWLASGADCAGLSTTSQKRWWEYHGLRSIAVLTRSSSCRYETFVPWHELRQR